MGSDVLRTACILADRLNIEMLATAHDAILVETPIERVEWTIAAMKYCMQSAASLLTGGFELRVDHVVKFPGERFVEDRGVRTLRVVDKFLEDSGHGAQFG